MCGKCQTTVLTVPGTKCSCGGLMKAVEDDSTMRKAYGIEDTDLRKGGLR